MSDQIKQIAERLQGLRDVLELTPDEVAKSCQLSVEEYILVLWVWGLSYLPCCLSDMVILFSHW